MNKKYLITIVLFLLSFGLSGCSLVTNEDPEANLINNNENQLKLVGYVLSVHFANSEVLDLGLDENNPFLYYEELISEGTTHMLQGNAIFCPNIYIDNTDYGTSTSVETYILLGSKFEDAIIYLRDVYRDPTTNEISLGENQMGYSMSFFGGYSGGYITVKHEAELKTNDIVVYGFTFELKFEFVADLQFVKVLEYNQEHELIHTTLIDTLDDYEINTLETTEYVTIEEQYKNINEEINYQRTTYSRGESYSDSHTFLLKFTNETGYVFNNKAITINFI